MGNTTSSLIETSTFSGTASALDYASQDSIQDCNINQGAIDYDRYYDIVLKENESIVTQQATSFASTQLLAARTLLFKSDRNCNNCATIGPKKKQKREQKGVIWFINDAGDREVMPPTMSLWYNIYVNKESADISSPRFKKKFRRRFRLPYNSYLELVDMAISSESHFRRWKPGKMDAVGNPCAPIELLVLTALRYLGRGWTFDDLSESTAISEDVIRVFFHEFIDFGSTDLHMKFVCAPATTEDALGQSKEYKQAGMPGAVGSMDATHVLIEKVSYRMRQSHLGHKHKTTSRSYNLVCNHRRRILATTNGHPARWNDKTVVTFDQFVMQIKRGEILANVPFELYDYDSNGNVVKVRYKGAWLLVDNGYHRWPITIPPLKSTTSRKEIRFSEWLESIRKDVECTFGILKGRWRILKAGIGIVGLDKADKVWKTCCALHNWLLDIDGLDTDWQGEMGFHEDSDVPHIQALYRLNNPSAARNFDSSSMGMTGHYGNVMDDTPEMQVRVVDEDGAVILRKMPMETFRDKLITHFDIAFRKREVEWPVRNCSRSV